MCLENVHGTSLCPRIRNIGDIEGIDMAKRLKIIGVQEELEVCLENRKLSLSG